MQGSIRRTSRKLTHQTTKGGGVSRSDIASFTRLNLTRNKNEISLTRNGKSYSNKKGFSKFKGQLIESLSVELNDRFNDSREPINYQNKLFDCCKQIEDSKKDNQNQTETDNQQLRFLLEVATTSTDEVQKIYHKSELETYEKQVAKSSQKFQKKIDRIVNQIKSPNWYSVDSQNKINDKIKEITSNNDVETFIKKLGKIESLHVFEYGVHRGLSIKCNKGKKVRLDFYGGDGSFNIRENGKFRVNDPDNRRKIHGLTNEREMQDVIRKYCNNSIQTINEDRVSLVPFGGNKKNCHQMLFDSLPKNLQNKVVNWLGVTCSFGQLYESKLK